MVHDPMGSYSMDLQHDLSFSDARQWSSHPDFTRKSSDSPSPRLLWCQMSTEERQNDAQNDNMTNKQCSTNEKSTHYSMVRKICTTEEDWSIASTLSRQLIPPGSHWTPRMMKTRHKCTSSDRSGTTANKCPPCANQQDAKNVSRYRSTSRK